MARRNDRLDIRRRLDQVSDSIRCGHDVTIAEELDARLGDDPEGHATVLGWLEDIWQSKDGLPPRSTCCLDHAIHRGYSWLKGCDDIALLVDEHRCPAPAPVIPDR